MTKTSISILDTTFARLDMGTLVSDRVAASPHAAALDVTRVTVPGFKDLTAAARRAIDAGADIVVACAMPGPEPIDESCASEASAGLQHVQALTGTNVLEVFVHMSEALLDNGQVDDAKLSEICVDRCQGHADNAVWMVMEPETMIARAGTGRRQGGADAGAIALAS